MSDLSARLAAIVDALPLRPGIRVLEIGGAPGAAAKAVARRIGDGHILVIDRSARGVDLAFAVRVGALDGRHPRAGERALRRIRTALAPEGRLLIDGGDPLREIALPPSGS